jgi:hypothetical protein
MVHAKRYMMLALCEDAVSDKSALNLQNSGSYGRLAWVHGLSDPQIRGYATQVYVAYQEDASEASSSMRRSMGPEQIGGIAVRTQVGWTDAR